MEAKLMAQVNNAFGLELFKVLAAGAQGKNIFLSPYSISIALAMTKLGARGETDVAMATAMQWLKEDPNKIHSQFQSYTQLIQKPSPQYQLSTANRIYIEKTFSVLEEFRNQTKNLYMAEAVSANFKGDYESERQSINAWVEEQTQQKIKDLLASGVVNVDTRMVLVNAIYFKGKWEKQFEERATRNLPFKIAPGQTKEVPMMTTTQIFPFFKDEQLKCSAVELPYQGKDLGMVIILPDEDFGLEALLNKLTPEKLNGLLQKVNSGSENLQVILPKFEVSSGFQLKPTLSAMGMGPAFDDCCADFSGMSGKPEVCISEVVHKGFIKVNEEGTEAAAATGAIMMMRCMPMPKPQFKIDHPFLFVIRDCRAEGNVLFLGQIAIPEN